MQVRNLRAFAVYLPYAGLKSGHGWKLNPQGLSPDLPTDRYYDPLLQRDWQLQRIELVFNKLDVATLGPAAVSMLKNVAVPGSIVNPGPVGASGHEADKPEVKAQDIAPKDPIPPVKEQDIAPKSEDSATVAPIIEPQIRVPAEHTSGLTYCMNCGKPRTALKIYPPMKVPICKFCYRDRDKKGDWAAEIEKHITASASASADQAERPTVAVPTPAADSKQLSLEDISKQNLDLERQAKILAGPMGSPLNNLESVKKQPPKPNPQY